MSKAIYMPKGKAGEYAKYACNFYVGCSNNCDYCYCKRGLLTARIAERIMASRKQTWHYNRQPITKQQAVELLSNN